MMDVLHTLRQNLYVVMDAITETKLRAEITGLPPLVTLKLDVAHSAAEEARMWLGECLRGMAPVDPYSATRAARDLRGEPVVAPQADTMDGELYENTLPDHLLLRLSAIRKTLDARKDEIWLLAGDASCGGLDPWKIECIYAAMHGTVKSRMYLGVAMGVVGEHWNLVTSDMKERPEGRDIRLEKPKPEDRKFNFGASIDEIRTGLAA